MSSLSESFRYYPFVTILILLFIAVGELPPSCHGKPALPVVSALQAVLGKPDSSDIHRPRSSKGSSSSKTEKATKVLSQSTGGKVPTTKAPMLSTSTTTKDDGLLTTTQSTSVITISDLDNTTVSSISTTPHPEETVSSTSTNLLVEKELPTTTTEISKELVKTSNKTTKPERNRMKMYETMVSNAFKKEAERLEQSAENFKNPETKLDEDGSIIDDTKSSSKSELPASPKQSSLKEDDPDVRRGAMLMKQMKSGMLNSFP